MNLLEIFGLLFLLPIVTAGFWIVVSLLLTVVAGVVLLLTGGK